MSEIWRVIPKTYGGYEASSLGRIRSTPRRVWFKSKKGGWFKKPIIPGILSTQMINSGYLVVNLSVRGQRKAATVHSLVAAAFLGPRPKGYDICHNNRTKTDNRVENLRYDTRKGNFADRVRHGTIYAGVTNWSKLNPEHVRAARASGDDCETLARRYGVGARHMQRVLRREIWKHC